MRGETRFGPSWIAFRAGRRFGPRFRPGAPFGLTSNRGHGRCAKGRQAASARRARAGRRPRPSRQRAAAAAPRGRQTTSIRQRSFLPDGVGSAAFPSAEQIVFEIGHRGPKRGTARLSRGVRSGIAGQGHRPRASGQADVGGQAHTVAKGHHPVADDGCLRSGWRRGQPWGIEVRLPDGYAGPVGRGNSRSVSAWIAAGVRDMDGRPVPDHGRAAILRPAGARGPAFMIFDNFGVILRYNNAESYAIGIGHLSDRIAGGGPIRGAFPPDAAGLTQADRRELQIRLAAAGFDPGAADGVIGARTRAAIEAFEAAAGLTATGAATRPLLERLRAATG